MAKEEIINELMKDKKISENMSKKEVEKHMEMLEQLNEAYEPFRKAVGKIAMEHGENPFCILLAYLETCVEAEKDRFESARKKRDELALAIVGALKIKPKEVLDLDPDKMTAEELKALLDLL